MKPRFAIADTRVLPALERGSPGEHPLYREAQSHLQRAQWEEALRCVDELRADFAGHPELEALAQEARLRARADKRKPRRRLGSGLPWRRVVYLILLSLTLLSAFAVGLLAFQWHVAPKVEENSLILQIEASIRKGQFALVKGDYAEADRQFLEALALAPNDRRALDGLQQAERGKEVARRYQQALELIETRRWSEAYSALMAVAELEPGYRDVKYQMSQTARQLDVGETFRTAEEAFQAADWRGAITHYETLRSLDSTYERDIVTAHLFGGYLEVARELAARIGTDDEAASEAVRYFNKALSLQPRDGEALAGRKEMQIYLEAVKLVNAQDWENAIPQLEALRTINRDYAGGKVTGWLFVGYLLTGDQAANAGKFTMADERYGLLLKLAQEGGTRTVATLYHMHLSEGDAAAQSQAHALAQFHYQEALKVAQVVGADVEPLAIEVYVRMAEVAMEKRDLRMAMSHYHQAVLLALQAGGGPPGNLVEAALKRADEAAARRDYATAVEEYKRILQPAKDEPAPDEPAPDEPAPLVYTVVSGDTVSKLALRFNTTVEAIVVLNSLSNPSLILVGQQLVIARPVALARSPAAFAGR